MQRSELIGQDKIELLVNAIFAGQSTVYESYSKYGSDTSIFYDTSSLNTYIETEKKKGERFIHLAIHYPETNGFVHKGKINLNPAKCTGANHKYQTNGWGLIHFQIDFKGSETSECRIAVNSEKRAVAWSDTYPDLRSPTLWDWKLVEKNARRLIRVLRKCA